MKLLFKAILLVCGVAIPVVALVKYLQKNREISYMQNLRDTSTVWGETFDDYDYI